MELCSIRFRKYYYTEYLINDVLVILCPTSGESQLFISERNPHLLAEYVKTRLQEEINLTFVKKKVHQWCPH